MSDDSRSDIDYSADGDDYDADPAPQVHYADDDGNGQSGEGDNGGIDSDAESVDFAVLPERVQIAVESQLRAELDRVEQEQRERHTEVVRLTQQKDEVGSELYGVQQQLAKMQEQLEVMHEEHSSAMRDREEAETRARDASVRFDQQKQERDEQVRKLERYQAELDRISETLVQVERYNEEMASKIAVKRRETYKAEQDVGQLEKEKKTQDVLIDTLQEQVRAQQETLATLKAQLDAQKAETAAARKALMDANSEMATIHFDRKVLVSQWKSSLVGMQRRDEAMRATESAVQQQKERMLSLDAELAGVEKAISAEQERNGQLSGVVQRLTTESEFLTRQIETSRGRTHEVSAKHSMLIRSLESTDAEIGRLDTEGRRIRGDIARVSKQIENLAAQKKAVEESVSEHTNSELTLRKGSEALARNVAAVQKKVRDREMELALVQNEVARIRMDSLTLTAQNDSLADALAEYERELSQRVATVERFESDIRRKHDEVERKQRELDKLNRRHESIMARKADAGEEADTGPLEATIKNLSRSIDKSQRETEDAQRLWLRAQTDLVTLVNKVSELSEAVQTLRAEQSVLEHKRSRLEGEHGAQEKEMRELKKATTRMHGEMVRINEELASSVRSQHSVAEDNFALESELEAKLAAMEEETAQLRVQIESNREEKRGLMEELVEAERQIMLWEKKIALSKETAETLDPTVGQEDLTRMKKEIHIMQVRYEQLQRDQKKLVDEMERLVYKREMIASKGRAAAAVKQAAASNSNSGAVTRAALQRDVAVRASELEKEKANATRYDAQIRQLYQRQQELAAHASQMGAAVDKDRDALQEVEQATHRLAMEKYGLIEQKAAMLRLIGKYGEVKDGKYRMTLSVDSVSAELRKAQDKNLKIRTLLQRLRVECPEVATQIDKIVATM